MLHYGFEPSTGRCLFCFHFHLCCSRFPARQYDCISNGCISNRVAHVANADPDPYRRCVLAAFFVCSVYCTWNNLWLFPVKSLEPAILCSVSPPCVLTEVITQPTCSFLVTFPLLHGRGEPHGPLCIPQGTRKEHPPAPPSSEGCIPYAWGCGC